ncbi:TRAP transporter small permease [Neptunicoccus sediminis]|uniref:TRAP transporter small permease n=1 Tax=Neptunicoccus sediminis TaxID=1892596 RepID=UPI0012FF9053|nr:TRAP transporter small permease subunit [Neptunicoccus sediminis]
MSVVIFVSTAAIICLISFLILSRFVFGWSIVGLLELSTLSALWLYMVGAIVASRNREHITVDFITQSLNSPRLRAAHEVAVSVIIFVFGLFFLSLTKDMIDWSLHRPQVTPGLGISLFYGQAALVAAAVVGTAYTLRDIIKSAGVLVHGNRGA